MALYLIDKPLAENALALARLDDGAKIALIQDGVYVDVADLADSHEIFAIADDVTKRGLASLLDSRIKVIEYGDLVDLIVDDKVYNFA
jgi:sulfur relay protein TusB/DsrH